MFTSVLARDIEEFLVFKRAMGRSYRREEFRLRSLDRMAAQQAFGQACARVKTKQIILRWLGRALRRKPQTVAMDYAVARQLCLFLQRSDPLGFVPDRHLAPLGKKSRFLPHIFSLADIRQLLLATDGLRGSSFRKATYRMLLLVLYCTGLRFGEAVRLTLRGVDLRGRMFFIANSKGRSRWVPFGDDLAQQLKRYLIARRRVTSALGKERLFVQDNGRQHTVGEASRVVRLLLKRLGLKPLRGHTGPRPYDLRHTFAVHRLTRWYDEGVDIDGRLSWLSAYMGHDNVLGTETYLVATPHLLRLASDRFAQRLHRAQKDT